MCHKVEVLVRLIGKRELYSWSVMEDDDEGIETLRNIYEKEFILFFIFQYIDHM